MCYASDAEKSRLGALLVSAVLRLKRNLILRECRALKDEKTEKPLCIAVIGGTEIIDTKK